MKKKDENNKNEAGKPSVRRKRKTAKQPASLRDVALDKRALAAQPPSLISFTLQVIYKNLYIFGITLLRRKLRYTRRLSRFLARLVGSTYANVERFSKWLRIVWKNIHSRLRTPFRRISNTRNYLQPEIAAARSAGKIPVAAYLEIAASVLRLVWTVLRTLFNYCAPVAAAWLLVYTIGAFTRQPLGLAVQYGGQVIGYVENEMQFEEAAQTLRDRFVSTSSAMAVEIPHFTLVGVTPEEDGEPAQTLADKLVWLDVVRSDYSTVDKLADRMIEASGGSFELAYGLYVNNRFYKAVTDRGFVTDELQKIRDSNKKGMPDEQVDFIKGIRLVEGLYPRDSIISLEQMAETIHSYETVDQVYVVQEGDSPSLIADKTGVPLSLLLDMNAEIETTLQIGQEVKTEVARPFLSVKNTYTATEEVEEDFEVEEFETATFAKGYREVTQEGVPGIRENTLRITEINGIESERSIVKSRLVKAAVPEKVIVGTNIPQVQSSGGGTGGTTNMESSAATAAGGFIWPTLGGRITVYVGGYVGHTGVDIPRPANTPIYAAASGTVVKAVYSYVNYGNHIVIEHGNGYQTYYAHATQLYVTVGQQVTQGQVIAGVGRTGRASGNHLHFEVRLNGRVMQPQNYIGNSG